MWKLENTLACLTSGRTTHSINLLQRFILLLFALVCHSSAAEISGQRFYYLKGAAAMLELALIQFAMQKAAAKVTYFYSEKILLFFCLSENMVIPL